jgi:hypothetical protein
MVRRWLTGQCLAVLLPVGILLGDIPASAFLAQDGKDAGIIELIIQEEILPRFEEAPGLVYGIEDLVISQDPEDENIRILVFTLVLTERTADGLAIVQKELTFRGAINRVPRLVEESKTQPWPVTPSFPGN